MDSRALNKIAKAIAYPLLLIDDILALLGKATRFSTFDLRAGYWQVSMDEEDRQKAAFGCHLGVYQFLCVVIWSFPAVDVCGPEWTGEICDDLYRRHPGVFHGSTGTLSPFATGVLSD